MFMLRAKDVPLLCRKKNVSLFFNDHELLPAASWRYFIKNKSEWGCSQSGDGDLVVHGSAASLGSCSKKKKRKRREETKVPLLWSVFHHIFEA